MVSCVLCSGDEKELFGGARLLRLGGHFPGSAVLHWSAGAGGKGVLCTGQTTCHCLFGPCITSSRLPPLMGVISSGA